MISINWRRGLFRLWIAASLVWLLGAGAVMQKEIRSEVFWLTGDAGEEVVPQHWTFDEVMTALRAADEAGNVEDARRLAVIAARLRVEPLLTQVGWARESAQERLIVLMIVLWLPPILLFALGWTGLWIVRGFRS